MKRLLPLACALALSLLGARAYSSPSIYTWDNTVTRVWPPASRGALADTMTRQLGAADSIDVTDAVPVFGARLVVLLVASDGADSMAVPILQTQLIGASDWIGTGSQSFIPPGNPPVFTAGITATSLINSVTKFAWGFYNEVSTGGTPVPVSNSYFRWRVKSTDARRYATPNLATLAPTGKYTIWAVVLK